MSADTIALKAPRLPPPATTEAAVVEFLHPGYDDGQNILLQLSATDTDGGHVYGIHHETARVACAILANCYWDGYLSTERNGPPTDIPADGLLRGTKYYFCLSCDDKDPLPYPVVPSFDEFVFPSTIPLSWTAAPIERSSVPTLAARDRTCRLSNHSQPLEIAHIIPRLQSDWWRKNNMFAWTRQPGYAGNDCIHNTLLLRKDLHHLWDADQFVLVPKKAVWVVHVLSLDVELLDGLHNLCTQPLIGIRPEFLLARFAQVILAKSIFVKHGYDRWVLVANGQTKKVSGAQCLQLYGRQTRTRTQSPSKRQRGLDADNGLDDGLDDGLDNGLDEDDDNDDDDDDDDDSRERGRPRKRLCYHDLNNRGRWQTDIKTITC